MLIVNCPGCSRRLQVREEAAGGKVKCPGCGNIIAIPRPAGTPAAVSGAGAASQAPTGISNAGLPRQSAAPHMEAPTVPPPDAPTVPPLPAARAGDPTAASVSGTSGDEAEWTTMLAPPQGPGEIGRLGGYRVLRVLGAGLQSHTGRVDFRNVKVRILTVVPQ